MGAGTRSSIPNQLPKFGTITELQELPKLLKFGLKNYRKYRNLLKLSNYRIAEITEIHHSITMLLTE